MLTACIKKYRPWLLLGLQKKSPYKCCRTHLSVKAFAEPSYLPKNIRCLFWQQKINRVRFVAVVFGMVFWGVFLFVCLVFFGLVWLLCHHCRQQILMYILGAKSGFGFVTSYNWQLIDHQVIIQVSVQGLLFQGSQANLVSLANLVHFWVTCLRFC